MDRGRIHNYNIGGRNYSRGSDNQTYRGRQSYGRRPTSRYARRGYPRGERWMPPARVPRPVEFDDSGSRVTNVRYKRKFEETLETNSTLIYPERRSSPVNELTLKIDKFLSDLEKENGDMGKLIFMGSPDWNPLVLLQEALKKIDYTMEINHSGNHHTLSINNKIIAEGEYPNKQLAKQGLAVEVYSTLKEQCLFIIMKKEYEEITSTKLNEEITDQPTTSKNTLEGSKAHQMMLKMGWKGQGLGVNEQGTQQTVAELVENVSRDGLGAQSDSNIMKSIHKTFQDFAKSDKLSILALDTSFSKEERAQIHKIAQKFNLKSKSEGKEGNRRLMISKKFSVIELVRKLLRENCESPAYKLLIPPKFKHLWTGVEPPDDE